MTHSYRAMAASAALGVAPQATPSAILCASRRSGAWCKESRPRLWLVAAGVLGQAADADDALHEAAIIGLGKFHTFSPGTNFEAWMAQITRLTALNLLRKRSKHRGAVAPDDVPESLAPQMSGQSQGAANAEEWTQQLHDALALLGETARVCLLLRVVGGLSYASIAAILDIPEGTAMSHVHRATKHLRATMTAPDLNTHGGRTP
jgi:RNA polymerase sigma-70 factor (ECF subfamily)